MLEVAGLVKRGRTYDVEDSRTTYRMGRTLSVLASLGIKPTIVHGTMTYFDWSRAGWLNPDRHLCSLEGAGNTGCTITWPEWATDDIFDAAYRAADAAITAEGAYNRSRIPVRS